MRPVSASKRLSAIQELQKLQLQAQQEAELWRAANSDLQERLQHLRLRQREAERQLREQQQRRRSLETWPLTSKALVALGAPEGRA